MLAIFLYNKPLTSLVAKTNNKHAKIFFNLGTGRRWLKRAPKGAINVLVNAMPIQAGR